VAQVFISYKHIEPDQSLATELADTIGKKHQVFIDRQIPLGQEWGEVIDGRLASADFLTALVSEASAESPMVMAEVERAHQLNVANRRPGIIPIRLRLEGQLRYPLSAYLNRFQQCNWSGPADTTRVVELVLKAIEARHEEFRPATQRQEMIKRVRMDWVNGVLEQSLYQVARIELGLKIQSSAVERGIDVLIQRPAEDPRSLAPGERLSTLFDNQLGQLLILGAPGSGKTTLLLELARELLTRAEHDESHPIPVVFNLSSWAQRAAPLAEWMISELHLRGDVPNKLAQEWVDREQILPLLDGLDEVVGDVREACVGAINSYRAEHGWVRLVVCSRVAEYEALTTKLRLPGAVVVQPLTRNQIDEYLMLAGGRLEGVRNALQVDTGLWELLQTPLMISIVALAFKDRSSDSVESDGASMQARREHLFSAYVREMFNRRAKETRFTSEQIRRWISWLATRMLARGQTLFQVQDIRSDWVGLKHVRFIARLGIIAVVTVVSGLIGWVILGSLSFLDEAPMDRHLQGSFFGVYGLYSFLFCAPVGLIHALVRSGNAAPAEMLVPHWPGTKTFVFATLKAALLGGILGGILGAGGCAALEMHKGSVDSSDLRTGANLYGMAGSLTFGFLGAVGALLRPRIAGVRSSPNLALYGSLRSSLTCFIGAVLLSMPFFAIYSSRLQEDHTWVGYLCTGGAFLSLVSLFIALEKGGYFLLDHFLSRYLLGQRNLVPWRMVRFLDAAAERLFLRKVGGGYIFVHRSLLEYFANQLSRSQTR
jgi:hypothetical protein